jgi:DNA-binding NtrC family response regulator
MNILLIEDNPDDARLVRIYIAEQDDLRANVFTAESMADGLAALDQGKPDLVLLDLRLPDAQGLTAYDRLRDVAESLPVVIISGIDDERFATEAVRHGAQDYLVKGQFCASQLRRSIRYALARATYVRASARLGELNSKLTQLVQQVGEVAQVISQLNEEMRPLRS